MSKSENSPKRRGLGRGLGALIVNTDSSAATDASAAAAKAAADDGEGVRMVPLRSISPNPHQPRTHFDQTALHELAESIREHGIIQPLIVTVAPNASSPSEPENDGGTGQRYWIVAGERRWRAARQLRLDQVPVIVREASTRQLMELALVENVQRADLNALEEAAAYGALMSEFHLTQAEVAKRVGKSRSAVANTVRLQQLPVHAQEALVDNLISAGHARALLSLSDSAAMETALTAILENDLSVRQTEALVKEMLNADSASNTAKPAANDGAKIDDAVQTHLRQLENRFRSALSTRVTLNRNDDGSGRLVVHFYSDEDLENIYRHIAGEEGEEADEELL